MWHSLSQTGTGALARGKCAARTARHRKIESGKEQRRSEGGPAATIGTRKTPRPVETASQGPQAALAVPGKQTSLDAMKAWCRKACVAAVTAALAAGGLLALLSRAVDDERGFIRVHQGRFVDKKCKPFVMVGWNGWKVMEDTLHGNPGLEVAFDTAQATGFTTLRFFAHGSDRPDVLQPAPGVYNETMFQALDRAIARAGQAGLKLILTFTNQWKAVDGKKQYVAWAHAGQCSVRDCFYYFNPKLDPQSALFDPTATATKPTYDDAEETQCYQAECPDEDNFFWHPGVMKLFQNHVATVLSRNNTVTCVPYRDDPTIMTWDLANELRCQNATYSANDPALRCAVQMDYWIHEMGQFLKEHDAHHMVTVGQEGFYSLLSRESELRANPVEEHPPECCPWNRYWASKTGQDFGLDHRHPSIDYASYHLWVDNWGVPTLDFQDSFVAARLASARQMGKAVVAEEFGKAAARGQENITEVRDPFYASMFQAVEASLGARNALQGSLFWEWDPNGTNDSDRAVRVEDTTFDLIREHAQRVARYMENADAVPNCVPGKARSFESIATGGTTFVAWGDHFTACHVEVLGVDADTSPAQCARWCAEDARCNAFSYGVGDGDCVMLSQADTCRQWTPGWKTFWVATPAVASDFGVQIVSQEH